MAILTHKTAVITGATKGIGLAIAEEFARNGCNLLLLARHEKTLADVKRRLAAAHPGISIGCFACDFALTDELDKAVNWLMNTPKTIDILVNNVGIYRSVSILDESTEDFDAQMKVNYYTPHQLSRVIGNKMRQQQEGHIFNISSIASRHPVADAGTYTVTKYALSGLTHVLRAELQPYGVKVTEVIPGSTLTSSWEGTDIPASRFVLPIDIAQGIMLCLGMSEGANVDELVIKPKFGNV